MSFRPAPPPGEDGNDDTVRMPRLDFAAHHEATACARVAELVAQAVDGTLPLSLELHLDDCRTCNELLREATHLSERIRTAARVYSHAGDFEARVLAALEDAKTVDR